VRLLKTIRIVDNADGSLTMVQSRKQVRENQNDLVAIINQKVNEATAIREVRELTVGKDWINTGTWKVTDPAN
jgi:hypothetical protein